MTATSRIREAQEARLRANTTGQPPAGSTLATPERSAGEEFIRGQLRALEPAIGRALPTGVRSDRFVRIILTEISKKPKLAQCHPQTILGAVMTAAQLGLEFGPLGHAYLVPYKGKCSLIVGYKGYIDLARRSGQLRSIVARAVHERDQFEFAFGTEETLRHRPCLDASPGPAVAYYGIARLQDGDPIHLVLSPTDVERFRLRSMSGASDDTNSPWRTDYDAMAMKTVIRRMVPWLPLSVEAARAIETDEHVIEWDGSNTNVLTDPDTIDAGLPPADPAAAPASDDQDPAGSDPTEETPQ